MMKRMLLADVVAAAAKIVLASWRYSSAGSLMPNLALEELVRSVVVEVGCIVVDLV